MDGINSARITSLGNRSCCSRLLFIYAEPFLIYARVDAVINPERSSYPKKRPLLLDLTADLGLLPAWSHSLPASHVHAVTFENGFFELISSQ